MNKFRESNAEYDDMTNEEIIQIYGLNRVMLNKYGELICVLLELCGCLEIIYLPQVFC